MPPISHLSISHKFSLCLSHAATHNAPLSTLLVVLLHKPPLLLILHKYTHISFSPSYPCPLSITVCTSIKCVGGWYAIRDLPVPILSWTCTSPIPKLANLAYKSFRSSYRVMTFNKLFLESTIAKLRFVVPRHTTLYG